MHATAIRQELLSFVRSDQEKIIAKHFPRAGLDHVSRFRTREERQFAFRCFWVPFEMVGVCEKAFLAPKGRAGRVWQFALVVAHSRMLKEMCAWGQEPRAGWWHPDCVVGACQWWMERYDSHLRAINASYCHWIRRKCPDC